MIAIAPMASGFRCLVLLGMIAFLPGCATAPEKHAQTNIAPPPTPVLPAAPLAAAAPTYEISGPTIVGYASWYQRSAIHIRTCTGQQMDSNAMSAASHSFRMGTMVRVTLVRRDISVVVTVNDCMPRGRHIIDLSKEAARELGMISMGSARVRVTPVEIAEAP